MTAVTKDSFSTLLFFFFFFFFNLSPPPPPPQLQSVMPLELIQGMQRSLMTKFVTARYQRNPDLVQQQAEAICSRHFGSAHAGVSGGVRRQNVPPRRLGEQRSKVLAADFVFRDSKEMAASVAGRILEREHFEFAREV